MPSQIANNEVHCPACNTLNQAKKQWFYGPKSDSKRMLVMMFNCKCGRKYAAWVRPGKVTVSFSDIGDGRPPKARVGPTGEVVVNLEKDFRNILFSRAYEKTGSLRGIAIETGYLSRKGLNGPIRRMWQGTASIPTRMLQQLERLSGISDTEVRKHIILPHENQILDDWYSGYREYLSPRSRRRD